VLALEIIDLRTLAVPAVEGSLVVVTNLREEDVSQRVAMALMNESKLARGTVHIELDPIGRQTLFENKGSVDRARVPTFGGPAHWLRDSLDLCRVVLRKRPPLGRIVLGDLGLIAHTNDPRAWLGAVQAFVSIIAASGWNLPVVAYDTRPGLLNDLRDSVRALADVTISAGRMDGNLVAATIVERWTGVSRSVSMPMPQ